ncbi:MAG: glucosaminidase domain-containing protein [Bacillota bacterium]
MAEPILQVTDYPVRDAFEGTGFTVTWDGTWNNGQGRVNVYSPPEDDGGSGGGGNEPTKDERRIDLKDVAGFPTLKKEMSGAQVALLQNLLIAKGYKIPASATGYFGDQTLGAVNAFKDYNKLGNTGDYYGKVGIYTWAMLLSGKAVRGDIKAPKPITSKLSKKEFVEAVFKAAPNDEQKTGVPAAITTAQAILESNYGKSVPTDVNSGKYSYNLFGIKGKGPAGSVSSWTHEVVNGKRIKVLADFRAYNNFEESIQGHSEFLQKNKRYKSLFNSSDPVEWAKGLQNAGYATDPNYADKLIKIMEDWNLI